MSGPKTESKAESVRLLGFHRQLNQLVEECAEVIAAAMRYRRGRIPEADLIEEIADVLIVANQFAIHYGEALDAEVLRKGVKASAAWNSEPRATCGDLKATEARMIQAKLDEVSDRLTAANIEIAALRRQIDEMEPARAKFALDPALDPVDGVRGRCLMTYEIRTKVDAISLHNTKIGK